MSSGDQFSDKQWWKMDSANMAAPIPLSEADLSKPFVYDREFGLFYCPGGSHPSAMSLLLAFKHGCKDGIDVAEKLNLEYSSGTADYWLEHTPGAAFRSSVGKKVQAGKKGNLTIIERRIFGDVEYIF